MGHFLVKGTIFLFFFVRSRLRSIPTLIFSPPSSHLISLSPFPLPLVPFHPSIHPSIPPYPPQSRAALYSSPTPTLRITRVFSISASPEYVSFHPMSAVDMAPASSASTTSAPKDNAAPTAEPDIRPMTPTPNTAEAINLTGPKSAPEHVANAPVPDSTTVPSAKDSSPKMAVLPTTTISLPPTATATASIPDAKSGTPVRANVNMDTTAAVGAEEDKSAGTGVLAGAGAGTGTGTGPSTDAAGEAGTVQDQKTDTDPAQKASATAGANDFIQGDDEEEEDKDNAAVAMQRDDESEIDSNAQERSQLDNGEDHRSDLGEDDEDDDDNKNNNNNNDNDNDNDNDAAGHELISHPALDAVSKPNALALSAEQVSNAAGDSALDRPQKNSAADALDAAVAKLSVQGPSSQNAIVTTAIANSPTPVTTRSQDPPSGQIQESLPQPAKDTPEEPVASYTSPNHEWARILKKRLGKGLSDAQMLARSNSMLASPSILAQSLGQVIPSLQQVKDAPLSPPSASRSYQTPEELFDRPAAIESSGPSYHYDDMLKDDAFPSSFSNSTSNKPLLLFAPLNPDLLFGKSASSFPAPTAPKETAPAVSGQPPPAASPVSQPQPQPVPSVLPQPQPLKNRQNEQAQRSTPASQPPPPVGSDTAINTPTPRPIPVADSNSPTAKATPPSPESKPAAVPPTGVEIRLSPLLSDSDIVLMGTGAQASTPVAKVVRQNVSPALQEDQSGATSRSGLHARPLLAQGSASSLNMTPTSSAPKEAGNSTPNYSIAPIQYTPLTQYKANPSRDGSKKKPQRDLTSTPKIIPATADINIDPPRISQEVNKEHVAPAPVPASASVPASVPVSVPASLPALVPAPMPAPVPAPGAAPGAESQGEKKSIRSTLPCGDEPIKGFWSPGKSIGLSAIFKRDFN